MPRNQQFFQTKEEAQAATQAVLQNSPVYQQNNIKPEKYVDPNRKPSYFEDPAKVVRWYNAGQSMPAGYQPSEWYKENAGNIEQAYKYYEYLNQGKDPSQWTSPEAGSDFSLWLNTLSAPPDESLLPWEKSYAQATKSEPVVDPNAGVPEMPDNAAVWQQLYHMFTDTTTEGPMGWNTARALQGTMAGLGTGGAILVGGELLAGGLALTGVGAPVAAGIAAATPYVATAAGIAAGVNTSKKLAGKEYNEELDQATVGATAVFNWLQDFAEGLFGLEVQARMENGGITEILKDLPSAWNAGKAVTFETSPYANAGFNLAAVVEKGIRSAIGADMNVTGLEPAEIGETWKMSQGFYEPVEITDENGKKMYNYKILPTDTPEQALEKFQKFWWTNPGLVKAREDLRAGKSYDEVKANIIKMYGDSGDTANFVMGALVDPSNYMNMAIGMGGELIARGLGKPALAKAFEASQGNLIADMAGFGAPVLEALTQGKVKSSTGLFDTMKNYKNMVRTGETLKIGTDTVTRFLKPADVPEVGEYAVPVVGGVVKSEAMPIADIKVENGVKYYKLDDPVDQTYYTAEQLQIKGKPYQETVTKYKNLNELDWFDRHIGGIDETGRVKELQAPKSTGNKLVDWYTNMSSLSPESRAGIMLYNLYDSLGMQAVAATSEPGMTDVMKAQKLIDMWDRMANVDATAVGDAGETFLRSPLAATLADSLKGVLGDTKVKDLFAQYINAANQTNIARLNGVAKVLQIDVAKLVEDLRNNPKRVYNIFKSKVATNSDPAVGKLMAEFSAAGVLNNAVDFANQFAGYTGVRRTPQMGEVVEARVPYMFDDFRARMVNAVYDYGFEYVKKNFGIKEQSAVYRLSGVLKASQSLLLLGLSPRYLINNGINNIVTRAAQGVFGFMTPSQVDAWWSDMGLVPARLHEGVTPTGGQTYEHTGEFARSMTEIHNMVLGDSQLAKLTKLINSANGRIGVFSNLSQKLESSESVQAYTLGAKAMWSKIWQPDKGFSRMSPQLEVQLRSIDPRLPEFIYASIQGNRSSKGIEKAIWKEVADLNVDLAINKALDNLAGEHSDLAREGLEKIGALDELRTALKSAKTKQDVHQAILSVEHDVADLIRTYELQKATTFGEELDNILLQEGFQAVPNMFVEMQQRSWDRWLDHYRKLSEHMDYIKNLRSDQKAAAWRQFLVDDLAEWLKVSNHELQVYSAILSKRINDGSGGQKVIDLIEGRLTEYNKVFERRKFLYEQYYSGDPAAPKWEAIQIELDDAFRTATTNASTYQAQIDQILADMFGPEHRDAILEMRKQIAQIQADMDNARNDLVREIKAGTSGYDVRTAWSKFQQEIQIPYINKLKAAEIQFGNALHGMEAKPPEDSTPTVESQFKDELLAKADEYTAEAKDKYAEVLERNDFRAQMKKAFGRHVTKEQWQAIFALAEMRAKRWAAETGKKPADWYRENVAAIKKTKPSDLSLKQEAHSWYYSKLAEVTEAIPQGKFTEEQYRGMLTKAGVKADELKWVDIDYCIAETYRLMGIQRLNNPAYRPADGIDNQAMINDPRVKDMTMGLVKSEGKLDKAILTDVLNKHNLYLTEELSGTKTVDNLAIREAAATMERLHAENLRQIHVNPTYVNNPQLTNLIDGLTEAAYQLNAEDFCYAIWEAVRDNEAELDLLSPVDKAYLKDVAEKAITSWETVMETVDEADMAQDGDTQYAFVNTPGGKDYRELLFYLGSNGKPFSSYKAPHFNRKGVGGEAYSKDLFAHTRFDIRTLNDGSTVLAVREIQSDRAQETLKRIRQADSEIDPRAYRHTISNVDDKGWFTFTIEEYDARQDAWITTISDMAQSNNPEEFVAKYIKQRLDIATKNVEKFKASIDMPFLNSWPELVVKRLLRYAVDNNFEAITLPTGPTAANIESHVIFDHLDYITKKSTGEIVVGRNDGFIYPVKIEEGHNLVDYVGSDIAKQLTEGTPDSNGDVTVTESNITWGGENMRWFYDRNLPNMVNKYIKKWGTKLEPVVFDNGETGYKINITADMKSSVAQGQPLFQRAKGATTFTEDGRAIIHALTSPDVSTPIHELMHVWRPGITTADQDILSQWSGLRDGAEYADLHDRFIQGKLVDSDPDYQRYVKSEEMVARGLEKVLYEGVEWLPPVVARVFDNLKRWLLDVYHSITDTPVDVKLTPEARRAFERMFVSDLTRKRVENAAAKDQGYIKIGEPKPRRMSKPLKQEAIPVKKQPLDSIPKIMWSSDIMKEAWNGQYSPMLREIGNNLQSQVDMPELQYGATLPADVRASLRSYLRNVYVNEMPGAKLTATRYGEAQRDAALLNYQKRYGFDAPLTALMPYELFYTRSFAEWAKRMVDKPTWYSMYARLQEFNRRHEKEGIPTRLRGLAKIAAPWLPDWADKALYYDPMKQLFPFLQYTQPFEQLSQDENSRSYAAQDELRKMVASGEITKQDMQAALETKTGYIWDVAMQKVNAEANDTWSNPTTLVSMMMGVPYLAQAGYNLGGFEIPGVGKGDPKKIGPTPMLGTANAIEQIGKDTPIQGLTDLMSGVIGGGERWTRGKLGLNDLGQYQDVWVDRQLMSMAVEGFNINDIMDAMASHQGELYQQALERAKYEQTLKTPGVGLAESIKSAAKGKSSYFDAAGELLPTLFPAAIISKGELEMRGLLPVYKAAWKRKEAGDDEAVNKFFDAHPEYEARLAQFKKPEDRMRNLLVGRIWDSYNAIEGPAKYQVRDALGNGFKDAFLDSTIADTSAIDIPTLVYWAKVLGSQVPETEETKEVLQQPMYQNKSIDIYPSQVNTAVQDYWDWKNTNYPNITAIQNEYYRQGKSASFLAKFPILKKYWADNRKYKAEHPEVVAYINSQDDDSGDRSKDNVLKPSDFAGWDSILMKQVINWAYTEKALTKGARYELYRIWLSSGQPGGTFEQYLQMVKSTIKMK